MEVVTKGVGKDHGHDEDAEVLCSGDGMKRMNGRGRKGVGLLCGSIG